MLPSSLRGRMLLLMLGSLMLLHVGSLIIYDAELRQTSVLSQEERIVERLVAVRRAVAPLPVTDRDDTAHALSAETLDIHWSTIPAVGLLVKETDEQWLRRLRQRLLDATPRFDEIRLAMQDEGGAGHKAVGSLRMEDGSWINFAAVLFRPIGLHGAGRAPVASTTVMALGVIAVALVLASSIIAPLRHIARAADQIGRSDRRVEVPEDGPDEARHLARAFNSMQDRLLRMATDRALALAAVSHDLRTPLQRLRLRIGYLPDVELRARVEADLGEMEAMINATLIYLRGADERTPESMRLVDLASLLQSLCDDAADMGQNVSYEGPVQLPFQSRAIGLKRAFVNLVENAVTYGGRARVTLRKTQDGTISIDVDDDGPGIPQDSLERVFEPFLRLDPSRNRVTGGVGLGLTIARRAIEENGGTLELLNRPAGGLTARVRFDGGRCAS